MNKLKYSFMSKALYAKQIYLYIVLTALAALITVLKGIHTLRNMCIDECIYVSTLALALWCSCTSIVK